MSRNKKEPAVFNPKILGMLVIILALLAVAVALFQVGISLGEVKQAKQSQNINNSNSSTKTIPLPPEEDEIFSRTGIVTEINNNVLSLAATIRKEDGFSEATLKIVTNDSTRFSALKTSPIPDKVSDEERITEISLKDIAIGNTITATAETNIKDQLEFTATEVRRIDRI